MIQHYTQLYLGLQAQLTIQLCPCIGDNKQHLANDKCFNSKYRELNRTTMYNNQDTFKIYSTIYNTVCKPATQCYILWQFIISIPLMYTNDQATFILITSDRRVTPSSRGDNPPMITTFQIQIKYLGNKWFKHTSLMYCQLTAGTASEVVFQHYIGCKNTETGQSHITL